jgi:ribosomal-protein-alanine N-acetyltransferase
MTKKQRTASTSQKVYLRELRESDFDEMALRFAASRRLLRGFAATNFDLQRFEEILASSKLETNEAFLICTTSDDAIAGQITLSQIFRKSFQNAYLGYQLFSGFTGNGFMTEAVGLVLRKAFIDLELHRIEANVQPENKSSIAVLRRNGFTKDGFS